MIAITQEWPRLIRFLRSTKFIIGLNHTEAWDNVRLSKSLILCYMENTLFYAVILWCQCREGNRTPGCCWWNSEHQGHTWEGKEWVNPIVGYTAGEDQWWQWIWKEKDAHQPVPGFQFCHHPLQQVMGVVRTLLASWVWESSDQGNRVQENDTIKSAPNVCRCPGQYKSRWRRKRRVDINQ